MRLVWNDQTTDIQWATCHHINKTRQFSPPLPPSLCTDESKSLQFLSSVHRQSKVLLWAVTDTCLRTLPTPHKKIISESHGQTNAELMCSVSDWRQSRWYDCKRDTWIPDAWAQEAVRPNPQQDNKTRDTWTCQQSIAACMPVTLRGAVVGMCCLGTCSCMHIAVAACIQMSQRRSKVWRVNGYTQPLPTWDLATAESTEDLGWIRSNLEKWRKPITTAWLNKQTKCLEMILTTTVNTSTFLFYFVFPVRRNTRDWTEQNAG